MTPPNPPTPQSVSSTGTGENRITPECQPVFPCWLWCKIVRPYNQIAYGWELHYKDPGCITDHFTHWHPGQPEAPATPPKMNAGETPSAKTVPLNSDETSEHPRGASVAPTEKIAKLRTLVEAALKWGAGPGWQKKAAEILEETK